LINMTTRKSDAIAIGLLLTALVACGPASVPTPTVAERATGLALTAAVVLTSTAAAQAAQVTPASPTAPPSPTLPPTATVPATPTPVPTDTPTPAISPTPCENDSAFVSDVSVPDGTHIAPGAAFVKTWRLRNDGMCTWTTAYTIRHVSGDALGGTTLNLPTEVPAGETVDISVSLTAPAAAGTFRGEWQLHNSAGDAFGSKPFVEIIVP
jgi:hypothetical protein